MSNEEKLTKVGINWYPGHMEKTKKEIKELSPLIDFVLELVDARIPASSKIEGIDNIIKNKPRILVMTKKDLCDIVETSKWVKYYQDRKDNVILVNLKDKNDYKVIMNEINKITEIINQSRLEKGLKPKEVRGLLIGIPNVGKSTLINLLAKRNAAGVGNIPGFTKKLSWIKAGKTVLLDSPGILWPKFKDKEVALNLASMSAIKTEVLPLEEVCNHILDKLGTYYSDILHNEYNITETNSKNSENYDIIGKKVGAILKGGDIDYERVYLRIINDIKQGKIKGITFDRC